MSVFDNIFDADQIEQAVMDMLKERLPTYLDEVAQQRERPRDTYQAPRSYVTVNEFDKWPEDKLPTVLIISPGMVDEPKRKGTGHYTCTWFVATAVLVTARNKTSARKLGMRYGAALRACMLQNRSLMGALDGKARVIDWISEDYDDLPPDAGKNLHAAKNIFHVQVDDVVNVNAGPTEWLPDGDDGHSPDYGDWPTADPDKLTVDVTLDFDDEEEQP